MAESSEEPDNAVGPAEFEEQEEGAEGTGIEETMETVDSTPDIVQLPSGAPLTSLEALAITRASRTQVVVLAGDQESGKTTLLASIYHKFMDGPFAEVLFAGSLTLPAFEERCHESRVASGRTTPTTRRTRYTDHLEYLHLRVRDAQREPRNLDLLLSDITGERFEAACDLADACRDLEEVRRADHFALLLDAGRLQDQQLRHNCLRNGALLIRRFLEEGLLDSGSRVDVLFTKCDLLSVDDDGNMSFLYESTVRETITRTAGSQVARLRFHRVAACPTDRPDLGEAYGVEQVLRGWLDEGGRDWTPELKEHTASAPLREMSRYAERVAGVAAQ